MEHLLLLVLAFVLMAVIGSIFASSFVDVFFKIISDLFDIISRNSSRNSSSSGFSCAQEKECGCCENDIRKSYGIDQHALENCINKSIGFGYWNGYVDVTEVANGYSQEFEAITVQIANEVHTYICRKTEITQIISSIIGLASSSEVAVFSSSPLCRCSIQPARSCSCIINDVNSRINFLLRVENTGNILVHNI